MSQQVTTGYNRFFEQLVNRKITGYSILKNGLTLTAVRLGLQLGPVQFQLFSS